ncbi:MAG: RecX family transcriptional regulator [Clostridia bacterium]|nr:RecX family transcriptional regulator [Clostridia bacterium]
MRHSFDTRERPKARAGSPMDAALKFLSYRARTAREVERHLDERQFGEVEIYETVERLKELGLIDDRAFAEEFIRTRLAAKPLSRRRLYEQLLSHELERETIEAALACVDEAREADNARAVADKYMRQLAALPEEERRRRVRQRLLSRGYSFEDADAALEAALAAETAP